MNKKLCTTFSAAFLLILLLTTAKAQMPDSVKTYIDSAIYIMQHHSLYGKNLNWKQIKDTVYLKAEEAKNYQDAFPALVYAFEQLKDKHGMVANQDTFYRYPPPASLSDRLSEGIKKEYLKGNRITTAVLEDGIVYLRVPSMHVIQQDDIEKRANSLRDSLCMLLEKNPKGIIVDLRMNNGGNAVAMLSGIGPLFDASILGYGVSRDHQKVDTTQLQDGVAFGQGEKMVNINTSCTSSSSTPIAVLIGPSTVSSGEIMAVYLKQQKNTKLFGETTAGFCNATEGFLFMNQQGYLLLSTEYVADANNHVYLNEQVEPDVYIKSKDDYDNLLADPTVKAALFWLKNLE